MMRYLTFFSVVGTVLAGLIRAEMPPADPQGTAQWELPADPTAPTREEVFQALPEGVAPNDVTRIVPKLAERRVSAEMYYPLVGKARLVEQTFRITVRTRNGRYVIYLDKEHLIGPGGVIVSE